MLLTLDQVPVVGEAPRVLPPGPVVDLTPEVVGLVPIFETTG
jgi:hypothetical protein